MSARESETIIWEFISLDEYSKPPGTIEESVKMGFLRFRNILRRTGSQKSVISKENLTGFPKNRLDRIVPTPDWQSAVEAFLICLAGWITDPAKENNILFVLKPPYSQTDLVLQKFAKQQQWMILNPPKFDQILENDTSWITESESILSHPFVLPNLEKCFLKHYNGLKLIRQLFWYLWSNPCQAIIGVDSWAWAFLKRAIEIDAFGRKTVISKPLDHKRLEIWLQSLTKYHIKRKLTFRKTNDGTFVLKPLFELDESNPPKVDYKLLRNLAHYSEGIPGVLWAFWRSLLRIVPEDELFLRDDFDSEAEVKKSTIWVIPWEKLSLPSFIEGIDRKELFVLHLLLIHNGMSSSLLSQILPLSPPELLQTLNMLRKASLIEINDDNEWNILPIAYPFVKELLGMKGYLTDGL
ncbi:MAG: hypothetical protein ACFFDT_19170 [Candidatus Hodarchaeota archaeon]